VANEVLAPIEGLPGMLTGIGLAIAETDKAMAANQLKNILELAKVGGLLAQDLGMTPEQVMSIVQLLVTRSMRAGAAEIVLKGDVSLSKRFEVEAGMSVSFTPFFALNAAGSYSSVTNQAWGAEVRVSLAVLPEDPKLVAEFIQRFQERETNDPEFLQQALGDVYPLIKEILGDDGTLIPPTPPTP